MLNLIFALSVVFGIMSFVMIVFGGGSVSSAGQLYKQDRNRLMSNMLDKKVGQLYSIRAEGKELKDKSAKSIFDYNNNSGVGWNDLNSAEKSQYEFLSKHIQSDDFMNGSK